MCTGYCVQNLTHSAPNVALETSVFCVQNVTISAPNVALDTSVHWVLCSKAKICGKSEIYWLLAFRAIQIIDRRYSIPL